MNTGISYEEIRANMQKNLSYIMRKEHLSYRDVGTLSGVDAAILFRWATQRDYCGPSFRAIASVLRALGTNFNAFCYTDMEERERSGDSHSDDFLGDEAAKYLSDFLALSDFDRVTVIRVMRALKGGHGPSEGAAPNA